jgi:hypothetical protein
MSHGGGARFEGDLRSAVEATLQILGWGGLCNEGMGRGIITSVERSGFADFERRYVEPVAELIGREATFYGHTAEFPDFKAMSWVYPI